MKIACISDTHGFYPEPPEADVIVLAGDYCKGGRGYQLLENHYRFCQWVDHLSEKAKVVGIAGNHDVLFESPGYHCLRHPNWTYLEDSECEIDGVKFWGTPWQPRFFDWAFNADEYFLEDRWSLIPDDTDVLIVHGPPHMACDLSNYQNEHTGSPSLRKRVEEIQPQIVICGHIHEGRGIAAIGQTPVWNVSYVDEKYRPRADQPIPVFELESSNG